MEGAFPPGDPNRGLSAVSTAAQIEHHENDGLGLFDRGRQLLGGESHNGVGGGHGYDARYFARVEIDVLGRDSLYMFIRAAVASTEACRSRPRAHDNGFARFSEIF